MAVRRAAAFAAVLVGLLLVVLWIGLSPPSGQQGAKASAPAGEPSASALEEWGPLAVVLPQGGADTARAEGTLLITDECTYLEWRGAVTLLVWPADRTRWNAETRAITFQNFDRSLHTARHGDHIVLGGSGDIEAESGISGEEWVGRTPWVARPAASCSLDARWSVGALGG